MLGTKGHYRLVLCCVVLCFGIHIPQWMFCTAAGGGDSRDTYCHQWMSNITVQAVTDSSDLIGDCFR